MDINEPAEFVLQINILLTLPLSRDRIGVRILGVDISKLNEFSQ